MNSVKVQAGKMIYEGLKDPKHRDVTKIQGDLLTSTFNGIVNAASLPKFSKS